MKFSINYVTVYKGDVLTWGVMYSTAKKHEWELRNYIKSIKKYQSYNQCTSGTYTENIFGEFINIYFKKTLCLTQAQY